MASSDVDQAVPEDQRDFSRASLRDAFQNANPELGDGSLIYTLNSEEELAIFKQMQERGKEDATFQSSHPVWQLACLRARKYDIERGIELTRNYMEWRKEYGVETITMDSDELYKELLQRDIMSAAGNRDKEGRYVFAVRLRRTAPDRFSPRYVVRSIHAMLESLILRFPDAAIRGILLVMDMKDMSRSNMDPRVRHYRLYQSFLT